MLTRNHVEIDPFSISTCNHTFCTKDIAIRSIFFQGLEDISDLFFCIKPPGYFC